MKRFFSLFSIYFLLFFLLAGCKSKDNLSSELPKEKSKGIENNIVLVDQPPAQPNTPSTNNTPNTNLSGTPQTSTTENQKKAEAPTPAAKPAKKEQKKSANPHKIVVNRNKKTLVVYKNGTPFETYPVAVGKSETPTPKGSYEILEKSKNPGGPYGPRWMGLSVPGGHYGIHGTNEPDSIGKAVSKGCIRMNNNDVKNLYKYIQIGTPVEII